MSMRIFARRPYLDMFEDNLSESIWSSQALTVSMVSSSTANTTSLDVILVKVAGFKQDGGTSNKDGALCRGE